MLTEDLPSSDTQHLPKPPPKPTPWRWWLGGILLSLMLAAAGSLTWVYYYFKPWLHQRLCTIVSQHTDSLYQLEIGRLEIQAFAVELRQIRLKKDLLRWREFVKRNPQHTHLDLDIAAEVVRVRGVHWLRYLWDNTLHIDLVYLQNPQIGIKQMRQKADTRLAKPLPAQINDLVSRFARSLRVDKLDISRAGVLFNLENPEKTISHRGDSISLKLHDLSLTPPKIPEIGAVELALRNYRFLTPDGKYELNAGLCRLSSLDSILEVNNFELTALAPNTHTEPRLNAHLAQLQARGVNFMRMLYQQEFDLRSLHLLSPELSHEQAATEASAKGKPLDTLDIKKTLRELPLYLRLDTLRISRGSFRLIAPTPTGTRLRHKAENINLRFVGMVLGRAIAEQDAAQVLFSNDVQLSLDSYEGYTPDGMYRLSFRRAKISSHDSLLRVEGAQMRPLVSRAQFGAITRYQSFLLEASIELLEANKLQLERLAYQQEFVLGGLHLYAPDFDAYLDRRKPKRPAQKYRNFEHLLQNIPIFVSVDTFSIHQGRLRYTERDSLSTQREAQAFHQVQDIGLTVYKIQLGKAWQQSVLAGIDTKKLRLELSKYRYQTPNGLYAFGFEGFKIDSERKQIAITQPYLLPACPDSVFAAHAPFAETNVKIQATGLKADGVNVRRLILHQEIDWQRLQLLDPYIDTYTDHRKPSRKDLVRLDSAVIYRLLSPYLPFSKTDSLYRAVRAAPTALREVLAQLPVFIKIDTLAVVNAGLQVREQFAPEYDDVSGMATHKADSLGVAITGITLGKATQYKPTVSGDSLAQFYSGNVAIALRNYVFKDRYDEYLFTLSGIQADLGDSLLRIREIRLQTLSDTREVRSKYRRLKVDLHIPSINTNQLSLDELFFEQRISLHALTLHAPRLRLFIDKTKPAEPSTPTENALRKLSLPLRIDTLALREASVFYEERVPLDSGRVGSNTHQVAELDIALWRVELGQRAYPLAPVSVQAVQWYIKRYEAYLANSGYRISIDTLYNKPYDGNIYLRGIQYQPQPSPTTPTTRYSIRLASARLNMPTLPEILERPRRDLHWYALEMDSAQVQIYSSQSSQQRKPKPQLPPIPLSFTLRLDTFALRRLSLKYTQAIQGEYDRQQQTHHIRQLNVLGQNIMLDSAFLRHPTRYATWQGDIQGYSTEPPESPYRWEVGAVRWDTKRKRLSIHQARRTPLINRLEFTWAQTIQKDFWDTLAVAEITLKGLQFDSLAQGKLHLQRLTCTAPRLSIYRDKRIEEDRSYPLMPPQIFQKLHLPLHVDTLDVQRASIVYAEQVARGDSIGVVSFADIDLMARGISNRGKPDTTRIRAEAKLMGVGRLIAHIAIPLRSDNFYCEYAGELGRMKIQALNEMLINNQNLRIRKGEITKMQFRAVVKDTITQGSLNVGFKRIRLEVLRSDHRKRKFLTFLANVIIKSRLNPKRRKAQIPILYRRNPETGFVGVLWRALGESLVKALK